MKTILIIEDNFEVRENTAEILELSQYRVLTAENGKMGVSVALKEKPDLIICDIMMPVLDGYGVYHLLSKNKETATIPFIFLTAKSEKADFRKGMEIGVDDYITKPYDGSELLNSVEARLKKAEMFKREYSGTDAMKEFLTSVQDGGIVELTGQHREVFNYGNKVFVYREGQKPRSVFHVVSGKIKVFRTNDFNKELITDIFVSGDFFGYAELLEERFYRENAQALQATELMLIPAEDFLHLLYSDINTMQLFIRLITKQKADMEERMLNLAYDSLRRKVAYGLTRLAEKYAEKENDQSVLHMSRENMAKSMGIANESLIRTLAAFKQEKLIDLEAGRVIIIEKDKLASLPY